MNRLPPGTNYCQCPTCKGYFNSVRAFDFHRTGPAEDRRCLTVPEMVEKGMEKNRRDYWVTSLREG